jgi:hypothetical protein
MYFWVSKGRISGTYGGRGKLYTGFWWGNLRKRDNLEDLGIDTRKILKYMFNK